MNNNNQQNNGGVTNNNVVPNPVPTNNTGVNNQPVSQAPVQNTPVVNNATPNENVNPTPVQGQTVATPTKPVVNNAPNVAAPETPVQEPVLNNVPAEPALAKLTEQPAVTPTTEEKPVETEANPAIPVPPVQAQPGAIVPPANSDILPNPVPPIDPNQIVPQPGVMPLEVPKKKSKPVIIVIILVVVILALAGFLAYSLLSGKTDMQNNVNNSQKYEAETISLNSSIDEAYINKLIDDKVVLYSVKDNALSIMNFVKINGKNAIELRRKSYTINKDTKKINIQYYKARYIIEISGGLIKTGDINVPYYEDELGERYYRPEFTITSNDNKFTFTLHSTDYETLYEHKGYVGDYVGVKSNESNILLQDLFSDSYSGEYIDPNKEGSIEIVRFDDGKYYTYLKIMDDKHIASAEGFTNIENNKGKVDGVEFTIIGEKMTINKDSDPERSQMIKGSYNKVVQVKAIDFINRIDEDFNLEDNEEGTSYYSVAISYE